MNEENLTEEQKIDWTEEENRNLIGEQIGGKAPKKRNWFKLSDNSKFWVGLAAGVVPSAITLAYTIYKDKQKEGEKKLLTIN